MWVRSSPGKGASQSPGTQNHKPAALPIWRQEGTCCYIYLPGVFQTRLGKPFGEWNWGRLNNECVCAYPSGRYSFSILGAR